MFDVPALIPTAVLSLPFVPVAFVSFKAAQPIAVLEFPVVFVYNPVLVAVWNRSNPPDVGGAVIVTDGGVAVL